MSFRRPVNVAVCKSPGTIFSVDPGTGGGSGGGGDYMFVNLGVVGARVYAQTIARNVQFRRIVQGNNVLVTENANDITIDVNDLLFNGNRAIKRNVTGLLGVNLGTTTLLAAIEQLLYPTLAPSVSLAVVPPQFEIGDSSPLSAQWAVVRTDEPILTIGVGGINQAVTGNSQSGIQAITKDGLSNKTVVLNVTSTTKTASATATSTVSRKIRYGQLPKDGIGLVITDADINNLLSVFSASYVMSPKNVHIDEQNYLVIEIPVSLGNPNNFKTNGFVNNAFNKVRSAQAYANPFGYSEPTNLWVSQQFSTGDITLEIV